MKRLLFVMMSFFVLSSCKTTAVAQNQKLEKNYVLLVSFDGFRYDYPDRFNLPNFKKLQKKSSYAKGSLSSFPSKTFPNHYSIITGMYPGNHGIVDNKFYSPELQKVYAIPDRTAVQEAKFYGGIPLWQWLQQHGIKTASYFWVGSEAPILGEYPTYYKQYNDKVPYEDRIYQVMEWFRLPEEKRPQFVTLYFEFVDEVGHRTGTSSEELKQKLKKADELLGQILEEIEKLNLPMTTIITSDHGMIDMTSDEDKLVFVEEIEKKLSAKADFINNGMHCQIYLKNKKDREEVYQELKQYFSGKKFLKVYKKEETPERWHYRNHANIGDLLLIADAPYYMVKNKRDKLVSRVGVWGTHGYDPYATPEMMAIFYVIGKNIKENHQIPSFENVHIYPFISYILGIDSPKNIDGKLDVLKPILKK